jgi:F-type H+-transporting ATPase subunit gamma
MPGLQEIDRRIKSVKSTKKVTRAMQMVSAAKMRKAQSATLASRTYAELAAELIAEVGQVVTKSDALLQLHPKAQKIGVVLITTNRGLVGSFNANLLTSLKAFRATRPEIVTELVVLGKKAQEAALRSNQPIVADFPKYDSTMPAEDIYPIAKTVTDLYRTGQYREIVIVYNHFVSTLSQKPTITRLLPFHLPDVEANADNPPDHLYEPSANAVLNHLIPRIIESQLYQAILESDASEHSARMVMMKNATEAASDLISDLTLTYNQLRQNKITTELSEITAGKIALEDR